MNLDNGIRFTNAAWQLIALLPVPSKKAGNYQGKVTLSARKAKLFHGKLDVVSNMSWTEFLCIFTDCIATLCKGLVTAAAESVQVDCSDGFTRQIVPLVAAWLGDREEHEIISAVVKVEHVLNCIEKN